MLAATIHTGNVLTAAAHGAKIQAFNVLDFLPTDSQTWRKRTKLKKRGIKDPKIQATFIKQAFGFT